MNIRKSIAAVILAGSLYQAGAVDFTGSFSGFYAPDNWSVTYSGNATYTHNASVDTSGQPNQVKINGATGENIVPDADSPSIVDYSVFLQGTPLRPSPFFVEPVTVAFTYTFFDPFSAPPGTPGASDPNEAEVLQNGEVVAILGPGTSMYQTSTTFDAGDLLTLRVISGNTPSTDFLTITPIPEPSAMALAGLGAGALLLQLRRKLAKK